MAPLHASTIFAPCTSSSISSLVSYLAHLSKTYQTHPFLFALSAHTSAQRPLEPEELTPLVEALTGFSQAGNIGCLTGPVPAPVKTERGHISCSLAVLDKNRAKLFRSTIRGKEITQVGRWHAFRKRDEAEPLVGASIPNGQKGVDWENVWDSYGEGQLPEALQGVNKADVESVVYLSDKSPEGLANSLGIYPNATKLGLMATSTPFITGRPVTLFHNQNIYESGAVGVALLRSQSTVQESSVAFTQADAISDTMHITAAEGNMVNELDGGNPTQMLLKAIKKLGLNAELSPDFKDNERFYLGVVKDSQVIQMYNITAGDPSRGALSLETPRGPGISAEVQFFHRPKNNVRGSHGLLNALPNSGPALSFAVLSPESADSAASEPQGSSGGFETKGPLSILNHVFLAGSENGFTLSRASEAPWLCTVPGSLSTLGWKGRRD